MKTIVYTAILGGSDSLKPAPTGCDAVCFSDDPAHVTDSQGWEIVGVQPSAKARRKAWHLRCVPHELFALYDVVIWVDASFTVTDLPRILKDADGHPLSGLRHHTRATCYEEGRAIVKAGQADRGDVAQQLAGYREEGFQPSALTIACVLVRTHTGDVQAFNDRWDYEIRTNPGDNTQLSLDYCAWKTGIGVHHLTGVRKNNPYAVHDHADHKRRRKPYR